MNALNRKENNPNPSRRLRRWFPSRRRRHDPWLAFNMSTFTFDGSRSLASTGLQAMRTYGVRKAFDREWVTKNAPRLAISAEQFRVTTPNMNTTSKTETESISKIAPPQTSSVSEIARTSNLHAPPMARSACRSMPRHLSSSPNE